MNNNLLVFGKMNYILMLIGIVVLAFGFWLMTFTTEDYGQGTLEMTVGPLIVFAGFLIEIVAIIYKPKEIEKEVLDEQ